MEIIHPVSTIVDMRCIKAILLYPTLTDGGAWYNKIKLVYDPENNPGNDSDVTFIADAAQTEFVIPKLSAMMVKT